MFQNNTFQQQKKCFQSRLDSEDYETELNKKIISVYTLIISFALQSLSLLPEGYSILVSHYRLNSLSFFISIVQATPIE